MRSLCHEADALSPPEIVTAPVVAARGHDNEWKLYVQPALVIACLLLLQTIYFTGVISSDDMSYLAPAIDAREGRAFTPESIQAYDCHCFARFVYWKLIQGAVTVMPGRPWAMALPSMLAAVVMFVVVFMLARRFFDRQAALVAMVVSGVVPVVVCSASVAVPDLVAGAFAWVGVYLVATTMLPSEGHERSMGSVMVRCALAGLVIAAGYNAKEIVALFIPAMMVVILATGYRSVRSWQGILGLGLGAGTWLLIEAVVLWRWTGDWFFHTHAIVASQRGYEAPPIYPSPGGYLHYFTDYFRWLLDPRADFGFAGPLMMAGCVWALWKRSAFTWLMLAVTIVPLVYLTVGTTELADYRPIVHQQRYLVPLLPGMAILGGAMIVRFWRGAGRNGRRLMVAAGGLMLLCTLILPNRHAGKWYHGATWQAGYALFRLEGDSVGGQSQEPLLASHFTANRLEPLSWWLEMPEVERLRPPLPTSAEEWVERFSGRVVCVTAIDRSRPSKAKHAGLTLFGPGVESLEGFPLVASYAPPRDRLSRLGALLVKQPVPVDPAYRVELIRISDERPAH